MREAAGMCEAVCMRDSVVSRASSGGGAAPEVALLDEAGPAI
ncbi:hypothetical protein GCM10009691_22330 [Brevibacterium picturae]|uniref:Uncharacterized protein n=1 Tax=Brevibacterium picturae TaxID=260553 RepID=A0ABN2BU70_9MICO